MVNGRKRICFNGHAACEPFFPKVSGSSDRDFKDRIDYTANSKLAYGTEYMIQNLKKKKEFA